MPLFVEMTDDQHAVNMQLHIKDFLAPGGAAFTIRDHGDQISVWNYPLVCAPFIYFTVKGLIDYEFMEDAADIGENWLHMVYSIYQQTGNMWEWYNVMDKNISTRAAIANSATLGATAGAYIALVDTLGLE
ncbi:MAG: hypothetical protein EHM72_12805 [Calditrichaeota bacterium]|nr:MAG: hypothetical protein EHM72_12805 [Calditrichota bacterium]